MPSSDAAAATPLLLDTPFQAAVVGAGPAGLALVATLLDNGIVPILWVDPAFNAGRLVRYAEVPSNTKVKLFTQYTMTSPHLAAISEVALAPFKDMDPEMGCCLGHAQCMVAALTAAIRTEYKDKVTLHTGSVSGLQRLDSGAWQLDNLACAQKVYLATGSHARPAVPDALPLSSSGPRTLELEDMLMPSRIPGLVSPEDVVGVVGSSHSAVLVLRNLLELGEKAPKVVVNLFRSPLLYAQYMADYILYDNTGLKGVAADWAHDKLDTKAFELTGRLQRVCVKGEGGPAASAVALSECTAVVYAVGFDPNTPPSICISVGGQVLPKVEHDPLTGCILGAEGVRGFGIAFPERVTDPHGNVEYSVGLWKFMRYVRSALALPRAA